MVMDLGWVDFNLGLYSRTLYLFTMKVQAVKIGIWFIKSLLCRSLCPPVIS